MEADLAQGLHLDGPIKIGQDNDGLMAFRSPFSRFIATVKFAKGIQIRRFKKFGLEVPFPMGFVFLGGNQGQLLFGKVKYNKAHGRGRTYPGIDFFSGKSANQGTSYTKPIF